MIQVTIDYANDTIGQFTVEGHADSAPYGQDLVCAAVTSVTAGTVNAIEKMTNTVPDVKLGEEGGFLQYFVPKNADETAMKTIQLLLEAMIISLETIAEENNQYIKMIYKK